MKYVIIQYGNCVWGFKTLKAAKATLAAWQRMGIAEGAVLARVSPMD